MPFSGSDQQPITQAQCLTNAENAVSDVTAQNAQPSAETVAATPTSDSAATDSAASSFPTEAQIKEALCEVKDPEIGMNIIELGLVYDIILNQDKGSVQINMTLTSPGCPLGPEITGAAYLAITRLPGVKDCHVDLVWTPMWNPEVNPTEEAKAALGFW